MIHGRKEGLGRRYLSLFAIMASVFAFACFGSTARAATPAPACAWQYSSLLTNVLWPDSNALYWVTPFTAESDLKITVHGAYPAARYFSIAAYNAYGITTGLNMIHDSQIVPGTDGSYAVTVSHSSGINTVPFANLVDGATGYLELRVYVPNGSVQLPSLTFTTNSGSVNVPTCSAYTAPTSLSGPFNNPDNVFVQMYPPYPTGSTVTVIAGKAPTQVRYWSLCSYLWTTAVVDCRYDGNTPLVNGRYHLVLGQPGQKSTIVAAGNTYLQYAGMVMLRNLLGNQTTGDYAPVVKTCAITDQACIST
jgi:hypothetical protein